MSARRTSSRALSLASLVVALGLLLTACGRLVGDVAPAVAPAGRSGP